ncbi:MAG: AhpC/TSA family protein [Candidatus Marinimicrobia bacterium]|nr:AhpC/TSA family protein [Candidatus Neomarinimicrobiota bacterium]
MNRFVTLLLLIAPLMLRGQERVADAPENIRPILVGTTIPDLALADLDGKSVRLLDLLSKKPAVLIYYRGGWCPFCNRQLQQLQGLESTLDSLGFQIIAVSPDRPLELKKSLDKHELNYTLLSDSSMTGAKLLGLAWRMSEKKVRRYKLFRMDVEAASGMDHHLLPVPGVFILSRKGVVKFQYVNPNHRERLSSAVLLAAAIEAR